MSDLTIIFLTVNRVPKKWAEYHKEILLQAVGDSPIITISAEPLDWGNNLIQEPPWCVSNVYKQVLRGSLLAMTKYVAVAEDDTLYHKSHFDYRPPDNTFGYNGHRWGLLTWGKPTFYWKDRISNACMIAPRDTVVASLQERFEKYPESNIGELGKEKGTDIDRRNSEIFYSDVGVVFLSHKNSLDPTEQHKSKAMGKVQAFDIPYWGRSEDIVRRFHE